MTTRKIFGDVLIPGTVDYAVAGLRAACNVFEPAHSEWQWRTVRAVAQQPLRPGKRFWTRLTYPDGRHAFISISPGEFRIEQPSGPTDVIVEPPPPDHDSVRDRLQALLDYAAPHCSASDRASVQKLINQYSARSTASTELVALFTDAENRLRSWTAEFNTVIADLYQEGLYNRTVPLQSFSSAMALLQLQAILGRWIDLRPKHFWSSKPGSPYENPSRAFLEYVKAIADLPDRAELTQQLTSIGNLNYTSAVASIKRAINGGSLRTLLKQLELGFHQYSIAYIVARAVHSAGLESALRYTVTQAEEGFVCAHSGLIEPLSFVFDKPDDLPSYFIERLTAGVSDSELITAYSSPVFPLFTKSFVRVLVASGRTLGSGETFNRGLDDLKALESTYSQAPLAIDTPFENGWISLALLKAYKKQGNTVMAKAYATRVATMLVVEKSVRASA